ncbi:MAG: hypothetical protein AAFZ52_05600, partial [Bacteroidota bacterium]
MYSSFPTGRILPGLFTLLFILFLSTSGRAQNVRVAVIVPDPPPAYWDDYLEFNADIQVILTNLSTLPQEVKLIPTLTSDRGLSAAFQPGFQPLAPITLAGGETVQLNYRDLRALYGTPTQDDIQLEGISFDRLFASETIPEGSYTLCVEARDFTTNEPVSNTFGCDVFFIQQHEPPLLIWPADGLEVTPLEPQFLNFVWSATGLPGRVRYRFALYDLDEIGLFNPADAILETGARPFFETDNLVANVLAYDLGFPPLVPGHQYAVQITAFDPEGGLLFAQEGRSQVYTFTYQQVVNGDPDPQLVKGDNGPSFANNDNEVDNNNNQQNQQANYEFDCAPLELPGNTPHPGNLGPGTTITVGAYQLEILSGGGQTPIAGAGRILIPAFNTYVNVSFTGLDVNDQLQAYDADDVVRATDGSNLIPNSLLSDLNSGAFDPNELGEDLAGQLLDHIADNDQWLETGLQQVNPAINLPAGVEGGGMDLVLTGLEFRPTGAILSLFAAVDLPEAVGDRRLLFVGRGICLGQNNLGENGDLLLGNDQTFALSDAVELTFHGGDDGTALSWSEDGVSSLQLDAMLTFDQSVVPTDGQPLTASFTAEVEDYQDWTASATLNQEEWNLPGLGDFGVTVAPNASIVFDHSATSSAPGFALPDAHPEAGNEALWQGVHIPDFSVTFPEAFDVEVSLENVLLDGQGIWMDVDLTDDNLLPFSDGGDVGGWPIAINHLGLDIRGSSVAGASFGGAVKLPISETELVFMAPIGEGGDFSLDVVLGEPLEVDMWIAQMNLLPNSAIHINGNEPPAATLHGSLSIGFGQDDGPENSDVQNFSLPQVNFENFTILGGGGPPQLDGTFGLDFEGVGQGSLANFPLQLTEPVAIDFAGDKANLSFGLGLVLTEMGQNGFSGSTSFTLQAGWNGQQLAYYGTQLNSIGIEADAGAFTLDGEINFFKEHEDYGNGFAGAIAVGIPSVNVTADLMLMVGKMPDYRYFAIDAEVGFPGIPLGPSGLALHGLGGGFWMNMSRTGIDPEQDWTINDAPDAEDADETGNSNIPALGTWGSGATYLPQAGKLGFSAKAVFGLITGAKALNADVSFGMEFSQSHGVEKMWMEGNAYVMQDITNRDGNAAIHGYAKLHMNFVQQEYLFQGGLEANIANFLQVNIPVEAFYSPENWHFYLGRWDWDADPLTYDYSTDPHRFSVALGLDAKILNVEAGVYGYFMMGSQLPLALPPKPKKVLDVFGDDPLLDLPTQMVAPPGEQLDFQKGFAFGMVNDFHLGFDVLVFRLNIDFLMGLDVLMLDMSGYECNYDKFGINQYYGQGQAFAYLGMKGEIGGRIFGKERYFTFAELEAAADLDFKGPKPTWIKGRAAVKGE